MDTLLLRAGQAAGLVGLALLVFAVAARLAGHFVVGGLATGTLMLGGIGAMSGSKRPVKVSHPAAVKSAVGRSVRSASVPSSQAPSAIAPKVTA